MPSDITCFRHVASVLNEYQQAVNFMKYPCFHSCSQVGNFMIIFVILSRAKMRTVTNYFILSLAVADFLVGICVLPPAIQLHVNKGRHNNE